MPSQKLISFLDQNKVKYITIKHSPAFTAQEIAAVSHIPGKILAKTVVIKIGGKFAMAILPASHKISFNDLKKALGAEAVRLAYEQEFVDLFPDCEVGAMPPFGNIYGMDVYAAQSLAEDKEIAFNSCTHSELIKMQYKDFQELVKPTVLKFAKESI